MTAVSESIADPIDRHLNPSDQLDLFDSAEDSEIVLPPSIISSASTEDEIMIPSSSTEYEHIDMFPLSDQHGNTISTSSSKDFSDAILPASIDPNLLIPPLSSTEFEHVSTLALPKDQGIISPFSSTELTTSQFIRSSLMDEGGVSLPAVKDESRNRRRF